MSEMSRRAFGAAMIASTQTPTVGSAAGSPNILFICADEHAGPFLGSMRHPIVKTPNLDRLAASGVLFRNT
jgi:arylsulfatase A-like enzyme